MTTVMTIKQGENTSMDIVIPGRPSDPRDCKDNCRVDFYNTREFREGIK